ETTPLCHIRGSGLLPESVVAPVPTTMPALFTPLPTPKLRAGEARLGRPTIPPPCVHENACADVLPIDRPVAIPLGEIRNPCAAVSVCCTVPMLTMLYCGAASEADAHAARTARKNEPQRIDF